MKTPRGFAVVRSLQARRNRERAAWQKHCWYVRRGVPSHAVIRNDTCEAVISRIVDTQTYIVVPFSPSPDISLVTDHLRPGNQLMACPRGDCGKVLRVVGESPTDCEFHCEDHGMVAFRGLILDGGYEAVHLEPFGDSHTQAPRS